MASPTLPLSREATFTKDPVWPAPALNKDTPVRLDVHYLPDAEDKGQPCLGEKPNSSLHNCDIPQVFHSGGNFDLEQIP